MRKARTEIERVVVRGVSWVGDAVMSVPALRALRRVLPDAHITLATRAWAEGIFADADYLDDLLIEEPTRGARAVGAAWRQSAEWRRRRFDLAVLFQNSFQSALIAFAARVPRRTGYATDGRSVLLDHAVELPPWRHKRHEVYYYLHLIGALERQLTGGGGVARAAADDPDDSLIVSSERRASARRFLRAHDVDETRRPLVALCPGSTNSRAKRWPIDYYAALADRLIDEVGAEVILIGAREEIEISEAVAARMKLRPRVLTGRAELSLSVAVLSQMDMLISNDTGPAHVAAALGRPTLVIFGPTNPTATRPFSAVAEVLREPPECAPCMLRDCPIDHRCMTAITPDRVFARAVAALELRAHGGGCRLIRRGIG